MASYCFLKSGGNANICILKKTRETGEGLLRTRISVVGLWGLWRFFKKTPREPLTSLRSARKVRTPHNASQIHALDLLHPLPKHFSKKTADHTLPFLAKSLPNIFTPFLTHLSLPKYFTVSLFHCFTSGSLLLDNVHTPLSEFYPPLLKIDML